MAESQESEANGRQVRAQSSLNRATSSENQEILMLPRQKSKSRERRESRMYLVDGQLCWTDDQPSGYSAGRRHSSVGLMFGSSMDLSGIGQSIDSSGGAGSGSEEAVSYRIKWCRENIVQLKRQTWPMEKKLQVLRASKLFIKQHQGELKQSKQARDVIASTNAIFERYWRHFKREFANFLVIITPWEMRIKKIESHFGSVVASYFTFLRWIFWLNLANSLVMCTFVMVPELIENVPDLTGMRKGELGMQQELTLGTESAADPATAKPEFNPTLSEMWEFEGFLKFSPIFYGYYSNVEISRSGFWRNPLAYLLSAMLTYLFCFFCISRKLSQNTKLSRIGSKDDEYTFCWTVFVGWDFMIGNSETAYNKTSSLVMNLKERILEEKEQVKDRDWRLIIRRVMANVLTLMLIVASAYVVTLAVQRSENLPEDASLLQKNELQLVMSGIQFMFPPLFDVIGIIEKYHPRKALSWQLGRILFLDFLNFYTLMFSLFGTVDQMGIQLNEVSSNITLLRKNTTYYNNLFTTTSTTTTTTTTTSTTSTSTTLAPGTSSTEVNETFSVATNANVTVATPVASSGLNATTILTSVLLASSTFVPSNVTEPSAGGTSVVETSPLVAQTTVPSSTTPFATSQLPYEATTIPEKLRTSTQPLQLVDSTSQLPSTSSRATDEEDDYPDISEVLRAKPSSKRAKRAVLGRERPNKRQIRMDDTSKEVESSEVVRLDEIEREDSRSSDELVRKTGATSRAPFRLHGAFLPPIQDPYRKQESNWWFAGPTMDESQEEPLEGRLEVPKKTPTPSTTKRPLRPGLARPIGGKADRQRENRILMTTLPSLDDDSNEDSMEATEETSRTTSTREQSSENSSSRQDNKSDGNFVEPTTQLVTLGSSGSDYAVIEAESTTSSGQDGPSSSNNPKQGWANELAQGKSAVAASVGAERTEKQNGSTQMSTSCTENPTMTTTLASLPSNESVAFSNLKKSGFNASEVNYADCIEIPDVKHQEILGLNSTFKDKLKTLCWETMFGQEMVKIVVMDLVMTVVSAVSFEFMRACFVRYCNRFFFWDLERGFPGYQDFKIAENVLHLVNNQSTVWMGMFFAPGLPAINTVKLAVLMYVRSWAVLTCNIPHETVFKVSKSNNFYYWILLINLLICILPVAYAVTWIRPSWHCGPFGGECRMYIVVTKLIKSLLPPEANSVFRYLTSPGAVIPILISLILIIYYLASTVSSSKEANKELKAQLKKDKEQEAAVPEITNTTVTDPAPVLPAPSAGPQVAANPNSGTLEPVTASLMPQTAQESGLSARESRPKALLMPPPV